MANHASAGMLEQRRERRLSDLLITAAAQHFYGICYQLQGPERGSVSLKKSVIEAPKEDLVSSHKNFSIPD